MRKLLTDKQVNYFREEGWLAPLRAISPEEASAGAKWVDQYEVIHGVNVNKHLKIKGHMAAPWLVELGENKAILDAVEDLIGPNILLFGASIFAKGGNDGTYVSWHQDSAYFGLDPHDEVTAWVALTESTVRNGALQVLPRSHAGPDMPHTETYAENNMLARGQTLDIKDESHSVTIELCAGEFSLHHERTAHGSKQNHTDQRRIGFAFFYIPPHVRCVGGTRSAMLVRGEDRHGHWKADPRPRFDFDPPAFRAMRAAWGAYRDGEVKQAALADN